MGVPVWAVGTSAGTISAAAVVASYPDLIAGAVFTSSITRRFPGRSAWSDKNPRGIASMAIGQFAKPVLVVSHKDDQCAITPAADAELLAASFAASPRSKHVIIEGGSPHGDPCEAFSPHGFLDVEPQVVDVILDFVTSGTNR